MASAFEVFTTEEEARGMASIYEDRGYSVTVCHCPSGYAAEDNTQGVYPELHSSMSNANERWIVFACDPA